MEAQSAQHPDLAIAFDQLTRTASALLLEFHLDLASATISLARRVRTAAADGDVFPLSMQASAEAESIIRGAEALCRRIGQLPLASRRSVPDVSGVIGLCSSYRRSLDRAPEETRVLLAA